MRLKTSEVIYRAPCQLAAEEWAKSIWGTLIGPKGKITQIGFRVFVGPLHAAHVSMKRGGASTLEGPRVPPTQDVPGAAEMLDAAAGHDKLNNFELNLGWLHYMVCPQAELQVPSVPDTLAWAL